MPDYTPSGDSRVKLWLKADAGVFQDLAKTTPAVANGDPVRCWADQSGNGHDATQSGGTSLIPTLATAGSGLINSLPSLAFAGVTTAASSSLTLGNLSAVFPSAGTLLIVAYINADQYNLFNTKTAPPDGAADDSLWIFNVDGNGYLAVWRSPRDSAYPPSMPNSLATPHVNLFTVQSAAAHFEVFLNGTTKGGAETAAYSAGGTYSIGCTDNTNNAKNFAGWIAEIVAYNADLGTTDRQKAEWYLHNRYGVSLPYSNPNTAAGFGRAMADGEESQSGMCEF